MLDVPNQLDLPIARKLPPWLPDETLFSWCSRFHKLAVNGLASSTCLQLFGHRTTGSAHDLPCRIDVLVARTQGHLGDANQILTGRTLLPFYLAFKSESRSVEAIALLRGIDASTVKYRLGLLTSGLPADHPLKACSACMTADRQEFGMAYWHRIHQVPTVFVCSRHEMPLMVSPMKVRQVARFQWVLPSEAYLTEAWAKESMAMPNAEMCHLHRLAKMSECVLGMAPSFLADEHRLAMVIRRRLQELKLISSSGRIMWPKLLEEVDRQMTPLVHLPGMWRALSVSCTSQPALTRMLGGRSLMHPCRYMAWIFAFFTDWQDFMQCYERAWQNQVDASVEAAEMFSGPRDSQVHARAIEMILQGGRSLTATARALRVDFQTVAAWAAQSGISPKRRAKQLKGGLFQQMINGLEAGEDKKDIAAKCRVSVGTVTRIMRTELGLGERWHQIRFDRARDGARSRWQGLAERLGSMGVHALRRINSVDYAWLYRNDREWLVASNEQLSRPVQRGNHASARRSRLDADLANQVRMLAPRMCANGMRSTVNIDGLVTALPELSARLKNPDRWPLTALALKEVLSARIKSFPNELFGLDI